MIKPNPRYRAKLCHQQFAGKAAQFDKELKEAFTQNAKPAPQANEQPRVENPGDGIFSVDTLINSTSNEVEKRKYNQH